MPVRNPSATQKWRAMMLVWQRKYLNKVRGSSRRMRCKLPLKRPATFLKGVSRAFSRSAVFFVEPNVFNVDPNDADKKIDVDVLGRYFEWINQGNKDQAYASVLVECKNNSQPVAFFVKPQQLKYLNAGRIFYGGYPSFSMDPNTKVQERLADLLKMDEWHHYCHEQEIATQFCSFSRQGKKWKAEAMNHYSKSFADVALMAATDPESGFNLNAQCIQVQLAYPLVVFQGPIYCARPLWQGNGRGSHPSSAPSFRDVERTNAPSPNRCGYRKCLPVDS